MSVNCCCKSVALRFKRKIVSCCRSIDNCMSLFSLSRSAPINEILDSYSATNAFLSCSVRRAMDARVVSIESMVRVNCRSWEWVGDVAEEEVEEEEEEEEAFNEAVWTNEEAVLV